MPRLVRRLIAAITLACLPGSIVQAQPPEPHAPADRYAVAKITDRVLPPYQNEPWGFNSSRMHPASYGPPVEDGTFGAVCDDLEESCDPGAPAATASSGDWLRNGYWYTQQSAVYMSRSVGVHNNPVLARDPFSAILPSRQNILPIPSSLGYEPGLRSTIGRYLGRDTKNRDHTAEFTFLGLTHWRAGASIDSVQPGGLFTPIDPLGGLPGFDNSDVQSFHLGSTFNSYEFNYRIERRLSRDKMIYTRDSTWVRQASPACLPSVFAGFRVLTVSEQLKWLASAVAPEANSSYEVTTHNNLFGPQVGAELAVTRAEWRFAFRGKAGALVNWTSQSSRVLFLDGDGDPIFPSRFEHANNDILSVVGELNFIGGYQFTPNFGLRVSYDLMWVTNLALAQNQLTFFPSDPPGISQQHSLFYQGVSFGIELTR